MEAIASFAASPKGQIHALASQAYGVDPATGVADDVIAANLRAALFMAARLPEPETDFEQKYG